jgi:hypothetical protein
MQTNATAKKRRKSPAAGAKSDSFVHRGVRIMRSWTRSERKKEIGEAMRKVIQRGPAQTSVD